MSSAGNSLHVQVGKEPKNRTQNNNTAKNAATKGDDIDSTAIMITTTFNTAEKEDDTDSTATKTTVVQFFLGLNLN